jgi:hypothetical protein
MVSLFPALVLFLSTIHNIELIVFSESTRSTQNRPKISPATIATTYMNKRDIEQFQHCHNLDISDISCFGYQIASFPCKCLVIPLSDKRLRKVDLQDAFDKLCSKLKSWKHLHLWLGDRLILVRHALSAMAVFLMLVIDLPVWLRASPAARRISDVQK